MKMYNLSMKRKTQIQKNILDSSLKYTDAYVIYKKRCLVMHSLFFLENNTLSKSGKKH